MRRHYVALDGLRGVAAIAVLLFHQFGIVGGPQISAPLAVDFFFMLSGFVLAHAYGSRLDNGLTWTAFMRLRLIRLYPMLLLGIVLGGILSSARPVPHENVITFVATLSMLPVGLVWGQSSFLFNGILWSLFFELVASALYATPLRHKWLWLVPTVIVLIGFGIWAGSVPELGRKGLINFIGGFPRVAVPFSFGVILYSVRPKIPELPFLVPAMALAILFCAPLRDRWPYDFACIFVAFPLLLCIGAEARAGKVAQTLGRLSYPLYCVHWPLLLIVHHFGGGSAVGTTASIVFAWLVLKLYDEPVRAALLGQRRRFRYRWLRAS